MSEISISKVYKEKIKKLLIHNKHYYEKSSPKISDSDYDKLKNEILELEKKYPELISSNSPSFQIGFKPSKNFKKLKHRVKMLSLSNVFSVDDLKNFQKKILNYLNLPDSTNLEFSVEPKIDGISASLTYKNGKLVSGVSRGDGYEGELITENLKTIKDIPKKIEKNDFPDDIDIRGEVFIAIQDFEKINNNEELKEENIDFKAIKTSGDINLNVKISEIGGKNLFCKEIEESLIKKEIDIAVHSLKDMESIENKKLQIGAYIKRNDFRDVIISRKIKNITDLKDGVKIGSSSRRTEFQLKKINGSSC